jgi:hypothetical protein
MARRHYGFERRKKEDARRAKQEAKKRRKEDRAQDGISGPEMGTAPDTSVAPGVWEWFSPSRSRIVSVPAGSRPADEGSNDWVLLTENAEDENAEDDDLDKQSAS